MNDANISVTKGFSMALGVLSGRLLTALGPELIRCLASNCIPRGKESDDAETRKQAVKSLVGILLTLGLENIEPALLMISLDSMFSCLNDYQLDRRGDVGSWVREEAMVSLTCFFQKIASLVAT